MNIPMKVWLIGGAAFGAVVLGMFGLIDGDTLKAWIEAIWGEATEAAE